MSASFNRADTDGPTAKWAQPPRRNPGLRFNVDADDVESSAAVADSSTPGTAE